MLTILKQTNDFTTKLTVKQLVSFGRYPYSKGNISKNDEKIIDEYIDFLVWKVCKTSIYLNYLEDKNKEHVLL